MKNGDYISFEEMCEAITKRHDWAARGEKTINIKEAYEHYANHLGNEVGQLTADEKKLALLNWILDKGKTDDRT